MRHSTCIAGGLWQKLCSLRNVAVDSVSGVQIVLRGQSEAREPAVSIRAQILCSDYRSTRLGIDEILPFPPSSCPSSWAHRPIEESPPGEAGVGSLDPTAALVG